MNKRPLVGSENTLSDVRMWVLSSCASIMVSSTTIFALIKMSPSSMTNRQGVLLESQSI